MIVFEHNFNRVLHQVALTDATIGQFEVHDFHDLGFQHTTGDIKDLNLLCEVFCMIFGCLTQFVCVVETIFQRLNTVQQIQVLRKTLQAHCCLELRHVDVRFNHRNGMVGRRGCIGDTTWTARH